jgi:UDP-N-acetylglucosamine transferase subunit ALG13
MILVLVGNHTQGFPRLIQAVDHLAPSLDERMVAQIGHTREPPKHFEWFRFVEQSELQRLIREARLVIAQGAMSALEVLEEGKPLIIFPRRRRYHEHIDDHQVSHGRMLTRLFPQSIRLAETEEELLEALQAPLLPPDPQEIRGLERQAQEGLVRTLRLFLEQR